MAFDVGGVKPVKENMMNHKSVLAKDREKLKGYLKDWSKAEIPIFMAYFIYLLSIASRLSLAFQSDKIDPVFALGVLDKAKFRLQLFENKGFEKLQYVKYFFKDVDVQGESVFY